MKEKAKIVVVGSFNVDITGYAARLPRGGETVMGVSAAMGPGGKGFNQATAAARAGAQVTMVARIGKDAFSVFARRQFADEGLSQAYLGEDETVNTGCALIEVDAETAENRIIVVPGANRRISEADVFAAEKEVQTCDAVLTQLETNLEAVRALMKLARRYSKPVILNPAPFCPLSEADFSGVDVFTPNETEAEYFSGIPLTGDGEIRAAAEKLRSMGPKRVVITLGRRGAYCLDETGGVFVPSPEVTAVDTTGAGDAFTGALAVALSEGRTLGQGARFAACFAALSVTKKGACCAMPYRAEAEALEKETFSR